MQSEIVGQCGPSIAGKAMKTGSTMVVRIRVMGVAVLLFLLSIAQSVTAGEYQEIVTLKQPNVYKIDSKNILINTRYCNEQAHSETVLLTMDGYSGEITFPATGGKCEVAAVYGASSYQVGTYSVNLEKQPNGWYEISGQGIYLDPADDCAILASVFEALLAVRPGGTGSLFFGKQECSIQGLHFKMEL